MRLIAVTLLLLLKTQDSIGESTGKCTKEMEYITTILLLLLLLLLPRESI